MNKKTIRRLPLILILVISALLGATLGTGIAQAYDCDQYYLSVGYNVLEGDHDCSVWRGYQYDWYYEYYHTVVLSQDRSEVTVTYTFYDEGEASGYPDPFFGGVHMYDGMYTTYEYFDEFELMEIDGCWGYITDDFYCDELDGYNNWVIIETEICVWPYDGGLLSTDMVALQAQ